MAVLQSAWVYLAVGWLLVILGAAGVLFALFRDRSRGRRRCPSCWYGMDGVPGLKCPECGREAAREKKLLKTRRRWGRAIVTAVVVLLGVAVIQVPKYQRDGWYGLVPSSVLVLVAPADFPPQQAATAGWVQFPQRVTVTTPSGRILQKGSAGAAAPVGGFAPLLGPGTVALGGTAPAVAAPTKTSDQLRNEIWQRLTAGRLREWQSQIFLERYLSKGDPQLGLQVPERWVVGVPLKFYADQPLSQFVSRIRYGRDPASYYLQFTYSQGHLTLQALESPTDGVDVIYELVSGKKVAFRKKLQLGVDVRPDLASVMYRESGAEADAAIVRALRPRLVREAHGMDIRFDDRAVQSGIDYAVAFTVQVLHEGKVIGEGRGALEWRRPVWKDWEDARIRWTEDGKALVSTLEKVQVVFRSDPATAAQMYLERPFSLAPVCWDGQIAVDAALAE